MSRIVDATDIPSIDEKNPPRPAKRRVTTRWLAVMAACLAGCLVGAATLSDAAANLDDMAKIFAVLAFIVAMLVLALGMIGDAYRS